MKREYIRSVAKYGAQGSNGYMSICLLQYADFLDFSLLWNYDSELLLGDL